MAILSETIPVGEWLPDRADLESGGCLVAKNCIPDGEDYKPFLSFSGVTDALASKCYGGYSHIASDGTVSTFLATRTKIYKLSGASWTDVTNVSGDYVTPSDGAWFFTHFGDRVIATNYVDKIQSYVVGTSTDFENLITTTPDVKCRNFGVINNFLVCVDISDDDGTTPNRVRWSPINDPSGDWSPSQSTQADFQNCEDGSPGQGMAVVGGQNYGILLFKNAIYRMEYVGPPNIFTLSLVEQGRGPVNAQAVTWNGQDVFYRSEQGLYQFNGNFSAPIGDRKVDKSFNDDSEPAALYNLRLASDPVNKNILVAYTSISSSDGNNDKLLCYNWSYQRFTEIEQPCDFIFSSYTSGYTLEDVGAAYPDLETVPYSLDSSFWAGGRVVLGAVQNEELGYFQGSPLTALIETQETRLNNDGLSFVQAVLPVFEGGDCMVRIGSRKTVNGTINYTPYQAPSEETGEVNFENEARYHRAGIELSGDWEHFQGVRYRAEPGGQI